RRRAIGPVGDRRQQARRQWQHRQCLRRQGRAGRLHRALQHLVCGAEPLAVQEAELRPAEGPGPGGAHRRGAAGPGGQPPPAGQERRRAGRLCEEEPGPAVLRFGGQRQCHPPGGLPGGAALGHRGQPCALQGQRAGRCRPGRRADRFHDRHRQFGGPLHQGRQAASAGGVHRRPPAQFSAGAHPGRERHERLRGRSLAGRDGADPHAAARHRPAQQGLCAGAQGP
ncbi:hypothetical protein KXX11_003370, partial [Aspergillus fumigatus]